MPQSVHQPSWNMYAHVNSIIVIPPNWSVYDVDCMQNYLDMCPVALSVH